MSRSKSLEPVAKKPKWEVYRSILSPTTTVYVQLNMGKYSESKAVSRSNDLNKMERRIRRAKYKLLKEYKEWRNYWKKEKSYINSLRGFVSET